MAKKQDLGLNNISGLDNPLRKTEPAETKTTERKQPDPVKPRGIGLRLSEWQRLAAIGQELGGQKANRLAAWAIRDFMRRFEAGEIETKTETRRKLPGQ
jgi:hypothetical protein